MKFAKVVFWVAGIWGVLVLTPLFFIFDSIGRNDPPPVTHPGFYYGFATVALAFQFVFAVIARDPVRFRPMMIPSIFEKMSYATTVVVLYLQRRMHAADLVLAGADFLLGLLFIVAFFRTGIVSFFREGGVRS
jgi:hypothetical protein